MVSSVELSNDIFSHPPSSTFSWKGLGGRTITNLRFADDIDALAEEEQEIEATRYQMEI